MPSIEPRPPATRRATMREVAERADVALKTVSRVLNGESGVSSKLRARVLSAAADLDYQVDLMAGNLRRADRRSSTLGVLLADVSNPFDSAILRGVEEVAHERGVVVFAASSETRAERERLLVSAFTSRRVDGLVMMPSSPTHDYLDRHVKRGTPFVFVDRPPVGLEVDSVLVDNVGGARLAAERLRALGHRRIAHFGDRLELATARDRKAGFLAAIERAGDVDHRSVDGLVNEYAAEAAVHQMFDGPWRPTAMFTSQNLVTIGAIRALRRHGLENGIALIGFDDLPLADLIQPGISVVAQDPLLMGRLAAEQLFARLGDRGRPASHVLVPTTFIARGSGELPPT